MSTGQTWQTESTSLEQTEQLGASVGKRLLGGEVIELQSDLGGGKTAFVRGLARGMGATGVVHSPSFTLSNEYRADDKTLYHFDFYRLQEPGIMRDELSEALADPKGIVAVEWADIVGDVLPAEHVRIKIQVTGEASRHFLFSYPRALTDRLPVSP